jgi:hypothetical protein
MFRQVLDSLFFQFLIFQIHYVVIRFLYCLLGDNKHKLVSLIPENRDKMESIMKRVNILKYEQDFVMGYVGAALNICKNDADLSLLLPESLGQLFHPLIDAPTLTQKDVDNFKQVNAAAELRLKSHLLKLVLTN